MNLGFYYHIPVRKEGPYLYTAGYLGCFLDELAKHVVKLILFMHEAEPRDTNMDYMLTASNLNLVSLGRKPRPEIRAFRGKRILECARIDLDRCDVMLVRAPTHLIAAWGNMCDRSAVRMVPLLVGDYKSCNIGLRMPFPKKQIVQFLNRYVSRQEKNYFKGKTVIVNSDMLADKYLPIACKVHEVGTSTLSEESFFKREDTCVEECINLLYTGRFEWQKGLQELLDAFVSLVKDRGISVKLHFVGWQDGGGPSVEESIMRQAVQEGVSDFVIFHGKKKLGAELNILYRMADIYVLPSYAEGFPRTIWEAMANSCPVIATRVGAIPYRTTHGVNITLVNPKSAEQIVDAVLELRKNSNLRRKLIQGGLNLAEENTVEKQTRNIASILKSLSNETDPNCS